MDFHTALVCGVVLIMIGSTCKGTCSVAPLFLCTLFASCDSIYI